MNRGEQGDGRKEEKGGRPICRERTCPTGINGYQRAPTDINGYQRIKTEEEEEEEEHTITEHGYTKPLHGTVNDTEQAHEPPYIITPDTAHVPPCIITPDTAHGTRGSWGPITYQTPPGSGHMNPKTHKQAGSKLHLVH